MCHMCYICIYRFFCVCVSIVVGVRIKEPCFSVVVVVVLLLVVVVGVDPFRIVPFFLLFPWMLDACWSLCLSAN